MSGERENWKYVQNQQKRYTWLIMVQPTVVLSRPDERLLGMRTLLTDLLSEQKSCLHNALVGYYRLPSITDLFNQLWKFLLWLLFYSITVWEASWDGLSTSGPKKLGVIPSWLRSNCHLPWIIGCPETQISDPLEVADSLSTWPPSVSYEGYWRCERERTIEEESTRYSARMDR